MTPCSTVIESPLGPLHAVVADGAVTRLSFTPVAEPAGRDPLLDRLAEELDAYFAGSSSSFTVPVVPAGTEFQRRVWRELLRIPPGQTRSYAAIARGLGDLKASRAVGTANGANPIAILIPCHRVVRSGGALGGYAGGLEHKRWLLDHEARVAGATLFA